MEGLNGPDHGRLQEFLWMSKQEDFAVMNPRSARSEVKTLFLIVAVAGANRLAIL